MNERLLRDLDHKAMEALARIINCNEELLHDKDIWSRVHLPLGPGLGFLNLMEAAEPAYCAAWLQAAFRLSRCNDSPFKLPALPDPSGAYQVLAAKAMAQQVPAGERPIPAPSTFFLVGKVSSGTAQRAIESLERTQRIIVESCRGKIAPKPGSQPSPPPRA